MVDPLASLSSDVCIWNSETDLTLSHLVGLNRSQLSLRDSGRWGLTITTRLR